MWLCVRTLLAIFLLPLAAYQPPAAGAAQADDDKDAYEIYSLVMRQEGLAQHVTAWAIAEYTQPRLRSGDCVRRAARDRVLLDDFLAKNKTPVKLQRKFDLPEYALLNRAEVKNIVEFHIPYADEKPAKEREFPFNASVIFNVSAVGFNADHTLALVYADHDCGGGSVCGGGAYHTMAKIDGKWRVDADWCGWLF